MSLIDDIRADREKGTPGPWRYGRAAKPQDGAYDWGVKGYVEGHFEVVAEAFGRSSETHYPPAETNARRIARVPQMEAALLAAKELAEASKALCDENQVRSGLARYETKKRFETALAAFREATS